MGGHLAPLVLLLDNLRNVDRSTLEVVMGIADKLANASVAGPPVLISMAARPNIHLDLAGADAAEESPASIFEVALAASAKDDGDEDATD